MVCRAHVGLLDLRQRNALALLKWTNVVVTPRSLEDRGWSDTLKRLLLPP